MASFVVAFLACGAQAFACGTCSVGDPTLTVMGTGQPLKNRLRASLAVRHLRDSVGEENVSALNLEEQRLEFGVAYSPTDRITASIMMPLVHRNVTEVNLAKRSQWGAGDLELRLRAAVFKDRSFAPRHILSAIGGIELPTSSEQHDAVGNALPLEFQSGSGSWDPIIGLSYSFFRDPVSLYMTSLVTIPTQGHASSRGGVHFRQSATLQVQPWSMFGFRAGVEFRAEKPTVEMGINDPDSGGNVTYASVGLVALPHPKLVFHAGASIPVIERLSGSHDEHFSIGAGMIYEI